MADALVESSLTGFHLDAAEVTKTDEFVEMDPDRKLPPFRWLRVEGWLGFDDLAIAADHRLVVSERGLALFQSFNLNYCDISPYIPPTAAGM